MIIFYSGIVVLTLFVMVATARFLWSATLQPDLSATARLGEIDGLRGYLAAGVLVHHFAIWVDYRNGLPWAGSGITLFAAIGPAAVVIFFLISGGLFYTMLDRRFPASEWKKIYISRIFRLFPLLWVIVGLALLLGVSRGGTFGPGDVPSLLTWMLTLGLPDLMDGTITGVVISGVTWSLYWEWIFYLGLPVMVAAQRLLPRSASRIVALSAIYIPVAIIAIVFDVMAFLYLNLFVLGMLSVELARLFGPLLRSKQAALVGVVALGVCIYVFETSFHLVPSLLLAAFFLPVLAGNTYFGILAQRSSRILGELSYSIYLTHGLVLTLVFADLGWLRDLDGPVIWLCVPLIGIVVTGFAFVGHIYVERPFIRLGKRFAIRRADVTAFAG
ncbi:Peptidoglycan/LPS O-acetylase OafA/YrhL, contains acyltransferase and SGNH-hydrolase domains [Loktanella fryxellensis]|uniref:Peptidoglycan/LPS O-acetylase OafA/YrhL, contains acyltransferase and SGNH-hydrolase domains n=1 Tax=Loktanella fryxellensis TaxID=245187 RepID=A0A1H8ADV6_9RHOB|nr:acyltransferase [Loktanella fryxellensis]SEM68018.1 Peptidoglycan/LPS O-acetylase OafA/YrhL, contains acyltransferase and SGNH-hydrolase domains [Loktanella fryxellensis]